MLSDRTPQRLHTIYYIQDAWRFTLLWTLIAYAVFHAGAVLVTVLTHGWKKSSWSYLWAVPGVYLVAAGLEAVLAGSVVGLVCVASLARLDWTFELTFANRLGAVYRAGYYEMNTWIPCTWGIINVLTLVISSFSIQGGL